VLTVKPLGAGAEFGLIKFVQQDEHYWVLVGEL
jgi:hypothetical protein